MADKDDDRDETNEDAPEAKPADGDAEGEAKPAEITAKPVKKRGPGSRGRAPVRQGSSLGKSMILFLVIILGIGGVIALLGREDAPPGPNKPKWATGQTVDVEITLVKTDRGDLACGSPTTVGGKHCAFEAQGKPFAQPTTDDKLILKPYTTTDRIQFTAAGLWSEPVLAPDKVPPSRFNVKCKYKVEGTIKAPAVRWNETGPWHASTDEWFAGSVSNCQIAK
jgi:hypothetical protein